MSQNTARRDPHAKPEDETSPSPGPGGQNTSKSCGYAGPLLSRPAMATCVSMAKLRSPVVAS